MKAGDDFHIVKRKEWLREPMVEYKSVKFVNRTVALLFIYLLGHIVYALYN